MNIWKSIIVKFGISYGVIIVAVCYYVLNLCHVSQNVSGIIIILIAMCYILHMIKNIVKRVKCYYQMTRGFLLYD